jgi:NitT/TauT family transport system substrate-binding protein
MRLRLCVGGVAAMAFTRRVLATTTALTLVWAATAGCGGGGDEPKPGADGPLTPVTLLTGFGARGHEAYFWLGLEKGFFREEGLDVKLQPGGGTGNNLKLLLAGQAQFAVLDIAGAAVAYGGAPGAPANQRVTGWAVVSALHQRSLSAIATLPGYGITTPRDLAGKRIGYTPGGVNHTMFPAWAKLAGVDASRIQWKQMQPPQLLPALAAHTVDATVQVVVGAPEIKQVTGRDPIIFPYDQQWSDVYGNGLGVSRELAAADPDLVARVNRAVLRSLEHAVANPVEAGAIFHKEFENYSAAAAAEETRLLGPYVRPDAGYPVGYIDETKLKRSTALLYGQGLIGQTVEPYELVIFDQVPRRKPAG